jgi:hypothetical protein
LASVLTALGALMFWRLFDLFRHGGRWKKELAEPGLGSAGAAQAIPKPGRAKKTRPSKGAK